MQVQEAKKYVGSDVRIDCRDRKGEVMSHNVYILDVRILPYLGPCFVTDLGEFCLERVDAVAHLDSSQKAA